MKSLRIGINALFMAPGKVGGTETYLRNLISHLDEIEQNNEYILFTNEENHDTFRFRPGTRFTKVKVGVPSRHWSRGVAEQVYLPLLCSQLRLDVMHFPAFTTGLFCPCPTVVTIHDLQYLHYPQYFSTAKRFYWGWLVPASARRSRQIIAISEFTASDIQDRLRVSREKIRVVHLAADERFRAGGLAEHEQDQAVLGRHGLDKGYILSVAATHPHKNLDGLIRAIRLLKQPAPPLVLVGIPMRAHDRLEQLIKELGLMSTVRLLGYVSDEELPALYRGASVFVFPSLFEGFGIPVLEAMASGVPVVVSDRTSLPEVAGQGAMMTDPTPAALADAISRVLNNPGLQTQLRQKGLARAAEFSFRKMALETLAVYEEAAGGMV